MKKQTYSHLGVFSDLVQAAAKGPSVCPSAKPGAATRRKLMQCLAFAPRSAKPAALRIENRWIRDGVQGELVTWSVGYGPRTEAWVLRPQGEKRPLPGVLAMHDHGGYQYFGKEKIADGPIPANPSLKPFRAEYYGGDAYPNELARRGFTVLVPDVFLWGSRKFPLATMLHGTSQDALLFDDTRPDADARQIDTYNGAAHENEHLVEKYLTVLGTTLSGVISYEDRVAAAVLLGRKDVRPGGIGCVGLSGGGLRTVLMQATCPSVRAAVVVGLMFTYDGILDHNIRSHTWACFPRGWTAHGDWPDIAACRAPSPLMVQYDLEDQLFTEPSMRAAHRKIRAHYAAAGKPANYTGKFYPGPHKFDREMQADAFAWLERQLKPGAK